MNIQKKQYAVLFVCLGNICRSPLAEAIFQKKISENNLTHVFTCDSCGTGDYHIGQQPDPRTQAVAKKHHVPINHQCRQLRTSDFEAFDRIIAMDESNRKNILWKGGSSIQEKVWLMRAFDPEGGDEVPDPYRGNEKDFEEVYHILDRAIDSLIRELVKDKEITAPKSEV
jgi:protein-tyrosine phosphatase